MSADLVLRGGFVVLPDGVERADVLVHEGRIAEVITEPGAAGASSAAGSAGAAGSDTKELDARGFTIFPGVIDAHVHFNEPGRTGWEGIATGSAALAAGGGTCFIDMPLNSDPPLLDGPAFDAKHAAASARSRTDFALYGGLTPTNLDRLEELAERGVVGFKAFMCPSGIPEFQHVDVATLQRGMETAAQLDLPVLLHAESAEVLSAAAAAVDHAAAVNSAAAPSPAATAAPDAVRRFIDSRPVDAELGAITRALSVAAEAGCRVHIVHVSSARGVELIRRAVAERGLPASCETCPHYLYFNEHNLQEIGARAKCAPPLRDEQTRRDLLKRLIAGDIDTVGSDHSPCPLDLKDGLPFEQAWGGIAGVQTTLRTLLTLGVPAHRIAQLTAARPAELFRLPGKGSLRLGNDADFTLVELDHEAPLSLDELQDRHRSSPYLTRALRGRVHATYLRGRRISATSRGQLIRPR